MAGFFNVLCSVQLGNLDMDIQSDVGRTGRSGIGQIGHLHVTVLIIVIRRRKPTWWTAGGTARPRTWNDRLIGRSKGPDLMMGTLSAKLAEQDHGRFEGTKRSKAVHSPP